MFIESLKRLVTSRRKAAAGMDRRPTAPILAALCVPLMMAGCSASMPPAAEARWTSVIVVRHAEKLDDSRDPALNPAGLERASALAGVLKHAGLDAVYASQYQRTRLTAMPTAAQVGLTVRTEVIDGDIDTWARAFAVELGRRHPGESALVVGHSNTVPALVSALCRCQVEPLSEADYDRLFIVNRAGGDDPVLIVARYGVE